MNFVAYPIENQNLFYYGLRNIHLNYSGAKSNKRSKIFDYTIELKLTCLIKGEKKLIETAPITISSIPYGDTVFADPRENRTDLIPMPDGALLTEVSIKISETNPLKVRAEKILAAWNEHKDDVRTIVNNIYPEAKGGSASGDKAGDGKGDGKDEKQGASNNPNKTTGNDTNGEKKGKKDNP